MWNDPRVDPWFYAMLMVALMSCALFCTRAKWATVFYSTLPIIWGLRHAYENAIDTYLSLTVPIRLDWPFVVMVALFPLIPIMFHATRMSRNQRDKKASNQASQDTSLRAGPER